MATKQRIDWEGFAKILHSTGEWRTFVIVSAELWSEDEGRTEGENALKTAELEEYIQSKPYSAYYKVMGNYDYESEVSFLIPNISIMDGVELGKFGEQVSIIYGIRLSNVENINVDKGETMYRVRMPLVDNPQLNDSGSNVTHYVEMSPTLTGYYSRFPDDVLEKWSFRIFDPNFEGSDKFQTYQHQTNIPLDFRGSED
jgi:hypothetical protein